MPTTVKEPDNEPCESDDEQELENLDKLHLDDFELLDVQESLGKGSFGVVQKIRRKKHGGGGKIYALKSMRKAEVIDGNLVDQVELEIQVQRGLKHRNVLRLYRHFEDAETVYLLLEFCARGELYQILRTQRSRRFSEERACNFFCQASEGLMYLHTNNVVHRDIKPENLLVTNEDVLKIADFGWCAVSSTLRTTFCGTLDYLAPEMIQGKGHDHTLDIWGAGVLLYEMVVGRPPFQSTNHGQLISKILKLELHFPATVATESFKRFKDLVRQLLRTDPSQRLELKDALRHPWVLLVNNKQPQQTAPVGLGTPLMGTRIIPQSPVMLASPQLHSRRLGVEEADSNDIVIRTGPGAGPPVSEEELDRELRSVDTLDNRVMHAEVSQVRAPEKVMPVMSVAPTNAQVPMPTTPAMATRGLQSPRVPSRPNHLPQPVSVSRPIGAVTTAVHPMRVSPTSTPLAVSRTLAKDTQPLQFVGASSMASDELSRSKRMTNAPSRIPAPIVPSLDAPGTSSAEQRARSAARQPEMQPVRMAETPVQSVVYRPLLPNSSPPGACRSLDASNPGTAQPEAPGTPGQRTAFRGRTLSPAADHRLGMGGLAGAPAEAHSTVEAVRFGISGGLPQRQGFPGRGVSVSHHARQPKDVPRREPREPLHHASSQHALQRGGAQSSTGANHDSSQLPTSPKLKPRRLTAAQPASVSTGIAGTRAVPSSMARGPMTAAGVLASPYPVSSNAFRGTLPEQVMQRSPHNTSLNTSLATNTTIDDDRQQSARCHQISEDGTSEASGARRSDRPPSRSAPGAPYSRVPTTLGGGVSLMRPQAMSSQYPNMQSPIYSQGQSRLASGVPRVPLQYGRVTR